MRVSTCAGFFLDMLKVICLYWRVLFILETGGFTYSNIKINVCKFLNNNFSLVLHYRNLKNNENELKNGKILGLNLVIALISIPFRFQLYLKLFMLYNGPYTGCHFPRGSAGITCRKFKESHRKLCLKGDVTRRKPWKKRCPAQ